MGDWWNPFSWFIPPVTDWLNILAQLFVGAVIALVAILILVGIIKLPGGMLVKLALGFGLLLVALGMALGWFAGLM